MADVEMTDAGAAPKVKSAKAGASGDAADGKKKFEVKKVRTDDRNTMRMEWMLIWGIVERRRALGMGHRRRQLRHLPKSHHGALCVLFTTRSASVFQNLTHN